MKVCFYLEDAAEELKERFAVEARMPREAASERGSVAQGHEGAIRRLEQKPARGHDRDVEAESGDSQRDPNTCQHVHCFLLCERSSRDYGNGRLGKRQLSQGFPTSLVERLSARYTRTHMTLEVHDRGSRPPSTFEIALAKRLQEQTFPEAVNLEGGMVEVCELIGDVPSLARTFKEAWDASADEEEVTKKQERILDDILYFAKYLKALNLFLATDVGDQNSIAYLGATRAYLPEKLLFLCRDSNLRRVVQTSFSRIQKNYPNWLEDIEKKAAHHSGKTWISPRRFVGGV